MKIYTLFEIKQAITLQHDISGLLDSQRQAFIDYSNSNINVPFPIQLNFADPPGDCHIKAGVRTGDPLFVVKVATGFYNNPKIGLPSLDGVMLLFSSTTGLLEAILCDEGYLTLLRTVLAAFVAAQITPFTISKVAIVGSGGLANLILQLAPIIYPKASIQVWGRNFSKAQQLAAQHQFASATNDITELLDGSNLVITATSSNEPLIFFEHLKQPVHVIALGSDEHGKQEIDENVFSMADSVLVDSKLQAASFGNSFNAIKSGVLSIDKLKELGNILSKSKGIELHGSLIVTDLRGIAAQDITISNFVLRSLENISGNDKS